MPRVLTYREETHISAPNTPKVRYFAPKTPSLAYAGTGKGKRGGRTSIQDDDISIAYIVASIDRHDAPRNIPPIGVERLRAWFTVPAIELLDDAWFWFTRDTVRFDDCPPYELAHAALTVLASVAEKDGFEITQSDWFVFAGD